MSTKLLERHRGLLLIIGGWKELEIIGHGRGEAVHPLLECESTLGGHSDREPICQQLEVHLIKECPDIHTEKYPPLKHLSPRSIKRNVMEVVDHRVGPIHLYLELSDPSIVLVMVLYKKNKKDIKTKDEIDD
ncbi:hypothetical protein GUJ93_ZPchr0001g29815 [Zizania palustris]|uniref:Uncharacterized protein n=1 Tax=Zizania palustris TaxID=103762 RepID=A0A8J5RES7_ZIZPA|nr:hypothetical protein GUJ93_ZPchr0001g29815 [Zizania palustris]